MASFLRKKSTLSRKLPSPRSDDAPPSLPPLILSSSLADPEPQSRAPPPLPAAASPPAALALPDVSLDDLWDPWKALSPASVTPNNPRLDSHQVPLPTSPPLFPPSTPSHPHPAVTKQSPRNISIPPPPKCEAHGNQQSRPQKQIPSSSSSSTRPSSPPAVLRGQHPPPSGFDFEESLSAANVTSVVNQFRSYPTHNPSSPAPSPNSPQMAIPSLLASITHRHHTSPQKPGSSSPLSLPTDATRRTNGSHPPPTSAVIHPDGRLDPVASAWSSSHPPNAPGPARSSSVEPNPPPSLASRPLTSPNVSRPLRSSTAPSLPPTSYPDRTQTLSRHSSHSNLSSSARHVRQPNMDSRRSGNIELANPARRGPLIFTATGPTNKSPPTSVACNPYPSPPTEHAPLEASPPRRNSLASSVVRGTLQSDIQRLHYGLGLSPTLQSTELPPLARKSSKNSLVRVERPSSANNKADTGPDHPHSRHRVLTKARPTTPQKPNASPPETVLPAPGDPLLLDEDPFARVEGVKVLKTRVRSSSRSESSSHSVRASKEDALSSEDGHVPPVPKAPVSDVPDTPPPSTPETSLPTPATPDNYKVARQQRRGQWLEKAPPPAVVEVVAKQLSEQADEPPREPTPPPTYFPIVQFLSNVDLLPELLPYLSYSEWIPLYSANKQVREVFQSRILRECVLERYLSMIGYAKWNYEWAEPLSLSLKDLHNYLRGVAMPTHEYSRLAVAYLQPKTMRGDAPTPDAPDILALALTTRAYTRVVLRLRTQAESEARYLKTLQSTDSSPVSNGSHPGTRQASVSSRAPSPTSSYSHSRNYSRGKGEHSPSSSSSHVAISRFRSPLYRPGRAPVLRVFVPSPEGDWLSDASVVECEAELKRSGILKLLRVGDVVWDTAVGDEGNLGRLMWDGSYLVDLDYRYSRVGELSPYFHSLAFSPSYFHRVIRIGGSATHNPHCNPIVYIDVSPWGHEIATNLQLLQDRARTETPHGALHDVVRWVHRSTFTIRPPVAPPGQASRGRNLRVPIPNTDGFCVDPGWYGTVVLESEGTNEGLADLQARCGPGVFPPRAETLATKIRNEKEKENRRVWRILREKSRPGEIWLRAVQVRERLM